MGKGKGRESFLESASYLPVSKKSNAISIMLCPAPHSKQEKQPSWVWSPFLLQLRKIEKTAMKFVPSLNISNATLWRNMENEMAGPFVLIRLKCGQTNRTWFCSSISETNWSINQLFCFEAITTTSHSPTSFYLGKLVWTKQKTRVG